MDRPDRSPTSQALTDRPTPHSIAQPPQGDITLSPGTERYYQAAQRMITLETRFPHPSATASPPPALGSLNQYGSPSSSRPSPASLPSKAKRWVRGPARRAPPSTPDSESWVDVDHGGAAEVADEVDKAQPLSSTHTSHSLHRRRNHSESSSSTSRCSTPCPTSPISTSTSVLLLHGEQGEIAGSAEDTMEKYTKMGGGEEAPRRPEEEPDEALRRTLVGIGAQLGQEVTLGYEIRNFRWEHW
ncbi:uncharacterized protein MKK02DRAFT_39250 [Dioszegia hungarica]|uniref:Uncharacterized protein n=1 Tax=Dioszegia hungarica TaxID=4972 RepID=A0AA38LU05_9TREE|nr:uncharacterized protein MKK02DRAFT_39250 [Dioszegia hungarica]KAI9633271.1 hypothetical protein MKK02DRAFT_39250 [Dioszegia hungarica]